MAVKMTNGLFKDRLMKSHITSNEDFFVRNHGGIPIVQEEAYFFDVGGLVKEPKRLTMAILKDERIFPRQSTVSFPFLEVIGPT